jgi:hypothetical protein
VIENNPWGCTSHTSNNHTVAGVVRGSEHYTGKIVYENAEAKTVGQISVKAPTSAAFSIDISTIVATTAINTAMGGTPSHDRYEDSYNCALKCLNTNGEIFTVTFMRAEQPQHIGDQRLTPDMNVCIGPGGLRVDAGWILMIMGETAMVSIIWTGRMRRLLLSVILMMYCAAENSATMPRTPGMGWKLQHLP